MPLIVQRLLDDDASLLEHAPGNAPASRASVEPAPDSTTRDVAISFASEDRDRADSFAVAILQGGYRVSYVEYGQQSLQGEDLYRHLKRAAWRRATA